MKNWNVDSCPLEARFKLGSPCYPQSWNLNHSEIHSTESRSVLNCLQSLHLPGDERILYSRVSSSPSWILFYFVAQHLILGENAILQATGSSYDQGNTASGGGGGGGGIIALYFTEGFVGLKPLANQSTKGGDGNVPGDNGLVIINGWLNGCHSVRILYEGCLLYTSPSPRDA